MVDSFGNSTRVVHTLGFPIDFGQSVDIIVSNNAPLKNLEGAVSKGVNVYLLNPLVPWKEIGWRINNLIPLYIKTWQIVKNDPNIVLHIAAPTPVTKPFAVSELGRRLKKPMVIDVHDPWSADPFSYNLLPLLQTQIMKHAINSADFVLVAHTALFKLAKSINKNKPIELVPNCVDTELFKPKPRNKSIAESIGINAHDLVVAFSGHIVDDKGLDVLVRAAQIIHQKHKNVKFLIVGDGPARKQVESLVDRLNLRGIFRFIGYVSQEAIVEYMSLADLCVAPYKPAAWFKVSLPETPLKVVEYLALGKPVVMSRISDENVVSWSDGGLLIAPNQVSELASTIISLIEDEKLLKTMGMKGRRYAEENLSWAKTAERLVEIYQSLAPF
jgi:glycosyltransferase involved in cell wall biosynthesis